MRIVAVVAVLGIVAGALPPVAEAVVGVVETDVTNASRPSVSGDGRWAVFGGTTDGRRSVFRTDFETDTTVDISPVPNGVRSGDTVRPVLSADGCVVVAITEIPFDLFRDDDRNDRWDIYRLVVPECGGQPNGWELVSSSNRTGVALDGVFTESTPAVSGAGALIAYVHQAAGSLDGVATISVIDITVPLGEPGRHQEVAGMPSEIPNRAFLYRGAIDPVLSQNGRHLGFVSDATSSDALPGWAAGAVLGEYATSQVYVWDRLLGDQRRSVHLISGRAGTASLAGAEDPNMSEDGRIVVFTSADRALVPAEIEGCTPDCPSQVFRFDRDTDGNGIFDEDPKVSPLVLVSAIDAGEVAAGVPIAGNQNSWAPAVNADGSQVAFVTDSTNLLASRRGGGGGPLDGDLLVAEVALGQIRRVLDGTDETDIPGAHGNPALSTTGQTIVFDTMAGGPLTGAPRGSNGDVRSIARVVVSPRLSLASLDFGTVLLGFESTELQTTVRNGGPAAFRPSDVVTSSPNFKVTGGTCTRGIIVAAGGSCSVNLTFNPTAQRGYLADLTVRGDGVGTPSVSTTIRGAAGEPTLQADPGGVDLEKGAVGETGGRVAIDIQNIGFVPASIVRIQLGGSNPDDFEIVTQACSNRALNPDASCAIEVEFRPIAPGYRSALLLVTTSRGQYTSTLLGGFARYEPVFGSAEDIVRPGSEFGVGGNGFPVNSSVSIGFDDGGEPFATVATNDGGNFLAVISVPTRVRSGERRLVATGPDGAVATTDIQVLGQVETAVPMLPGYGLG